MAGCNTDRCDLLGFQNLVSGTQQWSARPKPKEVRITRMRSFAVHCRATNRTACTLTPSSAWLALNVDRSCGVCIKAIKRFTRQPLCLVRLGAFKIRLDTVPQRSAVHPMLHVIWTLSGTAHINRVDLALLLRIARLLV